MLEQDEKEGLIELFYFDESGFSLVPEVPYAWQDKENPICLPSSFLFWGRTMPTH